MLVFKNSEGKNIYYSHENDWVNKERYTIAVWSGCDVKETEYPDFIGFVKEEINSEVEPVGSFKAADGNIVFVFLVKTNVSKFSIWRFRLPGMRWWFDMFSVINGGLEVEENEITPIIDKLGLKIEISEAPIDDEDFDND